jgi:hypothetical protein
LFLVAYAERILDALGRHCQLLADSGQLLLSTLSQKQTLKSIYESRDNSEGYSSTYVAYIAEELAEPRCGEISSN